MSRKIAIGIVFATLIFTLLPKSFSGDTSSLLASESIISYDLMSEEWEPKSETGTPGKDFEFDPYRSGFTLNYRDKAIPYELFSVFVLPGDHLQFSLDDAEPDEIMLASRDVFYRTHNGKSWVLYAPAETGIYNVDFIRTRNNDRIRVQLFVMVPHSDIENGYLNGYRMGAYPTTPLNGNPAYLPPRGFVEVTRDNMHRRVSPHFTLGQFLCKQEGGFPKYVVLQERLLLQLEHVLEESNKLGYNANTFHVMSGYRTPWYNQRIGNGRYSRHIYGDAADIFIDTGNGMMDDLNGDGVVDRKDAKLLFDLIDSIQRDADETYRQGGLGLYGPRPWRGPFVHVDGRGHYARWTLD